MIKKLFFLISIIVSFFFILLVFSSSIKYNILDIEKSNIKIVKTFLPQGWGFFTKDPRSDPNVYIYKYINKSFIEIMKPNGHYKNLFGLSKKSRMINLEISLIEKDIDLELWKNSINELDFSKPKLIKNKKLFYLKEGDYLLIKEDIKSYYWIDFKYNNKKFIYVKCIK